MKDKSIVILISGSGSNLQAIIDAITSGRIDANIAAVISNRADATGLDKAKRAGIKTQIIDHTTFANRDEFDAQLLQSVVELEPDLVVLAGFMRILADRFIDTFNGRLLNIHPSLLPKHKGLHTHQRVLDAGETLHGASVHFVNSELDSGSVIIQAEVPVLETDNVFSLSARVLQQEHVIYPLAIQWFIEGKLGLIDNKAQFNNTEIKQPATWINNELTEPT